MTTLEYLTSRVTYEGGRFLDSSVGALPLAEKLAITQHLVSIQHPLAYQPGTQEWRIAAYARELAR